jgi:hypothetical protein
MLCSSGWYGSQGGSRYIYTPRTTAARRDPPQGERLAGTQRSASCTVEGTARRCQAPKTCTQGGCEPDRETPQGDQGTLFPSSVVRVVAGKVMHMSTAKEQPKNRACLLLTAEETRQTSLQLCEQALVAQERAQEIMRQSRLIQHIMKDYALLKRSSRYGDSDLSFSPDHHRGGR